MGFDKDHPIGSIENDIAQARALGVDLETFTRMQLGLPTEKSKTIASKSPDNNRKKKKRRRRK